MEPIWDENDPQQQLRIALSLTRPVVRGEGLRGWLESLLPHAYVRERNPLYAYEMRGITRERSQADLLRGLALSLLRDAGFGVVLWMIAFLINGGGTAFERYDRLWLLFVLAFALTLLTSFALDAFSVLAIAQTNRQRQAGSSQQDLVRISQIDVASLVRARFAVAQIRVWNSMRTVIGLRLIVLVFALLNLLAAPLLMGDLHLREYFAWRFNSIFSFFPGGLLELMTGLAVVLFGGLLIAEPLWRMRALAAAGLASSTGTHPGALVPLYAAAILASIWLIQLTLLAAMVIILFVASSSQTCLAIMLPGAVLTGGGGMRMLYFGVMLSQLQSVYRRMLEAADSA